MFSNLMMIVPKDAVLFSTKSHTKLLVPFANSKTLNSMAVLSLFARIVNRGEVTTAAVEEEVTMVVVVEEATTVVLITTTTNNNSNIVQASCLALLLWRDASYMLAISLGRLDGVSSRITSVSVVTLTVLRSRKAAMERRRDSDSSASILPRTLQRQWTS